MTVMNDIIKLLDEEYIDKGYALKKKIISERTLRSLAKKVKGELRHKGRILIPLRELSSTIKNRIETEKQVTQSISKVPKSTSKKEELEVAFILQFVRDNPQKHKPYEQYYRKFRFCDSDLKRYCQTHAMIKLLIGFKNQGYSVKSIFAAYRQLHKEIPFTNFNCNDYDYFSSKLKEAEATEISLLIVNGKRFNTRTRKKFTKVHEELTIFFYKNPAKFSYKVIQAMVNNEVIKLGHLPVHLSRIKDFLRDPEIKNRYKPFRNGKAWAKDNLLPYLGIRKPKLVNSKWEMDSTQVNLYVWPNETTPEPINYMLCIVVEVKSNKILGHHLRPTEDALLNEITLFKAIMNAYAIPNELVHDNHFSYIKSQRFLEIEGRMEEMNCTITLCEPYSPGDKGTVERVNGLIQENYIRYTPGWLGFNLGSKADDSKVSDQFRTACLKGKHKLYLKDLEILIDKYVSQYNSGEIWSY